MKKLMLLVLMFGIVSCSNDNPWSEGEGGGGNADSGGGTSTGIMDLSTLSSFDVAIDTTSLVEDDTTTIDFTSSFTTTIIYANNKATVTGQVDGDTINVNNGYVEVIAHNKGMVLKVTGTTTMGSIKVYSEKKFELLLDNANITNPDGAAVNIQNGKCFVWLDGKNTLSDASSAGYTTTNNEDMKAVLFSEDDLRFCGKGMLTVNALNQKAKNAITSDDDIQIWTGCRLLVNASSSAGNGIKTNGKIKMFGGVVNVTTNAAGCKALKAESDIDVSGGRLTAITSGGVDTSDSSDPAGCAAIKADSTINISGGELHLKSTGQGGKGLSSDLAINISGGTTYVVTTGSKYGSSNTQGMGGGSRPGQGGWGGQTQSSVSVSPKGIRCDGNINITGGQIYVRTAGSNAEGIESKNTITIEGGSTAVSAYDDGMNATSINVKGGRTFVISTGQCDGVDSNGTLSCSGGLLVGVASTLNSEDGLDCESTMTCTGGTMIGFSNGGMSQGARMSGHYFTTSITGSAGQYIALCKGNTPVSVFALPRTYSNGKLLYMTGELASGTYSLYNKTTPSGGTLWMNYYEGATSVSGGTSTSVSL